MIKLRIVIDRYTLPFMVYYVTYVLLCMFVCTHRNQRNWVAKIIKPHTNEIPSFTNHTHEHNNNRQCIIITQVTKRCAVN